VSRILLDLASTFLIADREGETLLPRERGKERAMSVSAEALGECPSCHANVAAGAMECPRCGEPLAVEVDTLPLVAPDARGSTRPSAVGFREKFLFYTGIALILLGGPGIALGSWLHDILRVPVANYNAFDAFGSVNRLVAAVGLIVMVVGIVFFVLSLRLSRPASPDGLEQPPNL